jgi:hypothetical protein
VFHVNLKSDFDYGQVVVGVRPTLPVQDMSSLFCIDVAGDKVITDPIISQVNKLFPSQKFNTDIYYCLLKNRTILH